MPTSQSYNLNTLITTYAGQDPQGDLSSQILPENIYLFGAKGDGITDDTQAFNKALSLGCNIILGQGKTYIVNNPSWVVSHITLEGNGSTLQTSIKDDSCLVINPTVQNIKIKNMYFQGSADNTCQNAAGVSMLPNGTNYSKGNGIQDVQIENCQFLGGFIFGVAGSGVTGVLIEKCYFTGNYYNPTVSAGGYGVLMQTCYEVKLKYNKFVATAHDRHAIYISEVPTGGTVNNSCADVRVLHNWIDWTLANAGTGFETCMMVRSVQTLRIIDNDFIGGYGGNDFSPSKGNIVDLYISGNRYANQISDQTHSRAAITLGHDAYAYKNVTITLNHIISSNNQVDGIDINDFTDLTVTENQISLNGNGSGIYLLNGNTAYVEGNDMNGNGAGTAGLQYYGTGANYTIGRNQIRGFGQQEKYFSTVSQLSNMIHDYYRVAQIETTGTGTITIKADTYGLISSVVSQSYGCDITFNPSFLVANNPSLSLVMYVGDLGFYTIRAFDSVNNIVSLNLYDHTFTPITLATKQVGIYLKLSA